MDQAIYDTFARMSQPWINNIPEVDWHGANGSIQISGEPAASRYTEARLSKTTEQGLLYNIKKQNVPMKLNFSEDDEWPEVFPAIYPRLMVNGCQGIGSTIANCWLPHSLGDMYNVITDYLDFGHIDYDNLAPDFPTGGIIINKKDLPQIYKTGKGKVILRAKTEIKDNLILITEIPYQVYVEPLIEQIKKLIQSDELIGIADINNKSDRKRLLIEIECDSNPTKVLTQLFKKTNLQKSFSANQFALVGKTPQLLNLEKYLKIFLEHNSNCIKREYQFDLNKALQRLEIVKGLLIALEDIDNVIALIKKSESTANAVTNLMKKYSLSEKQATAIVNMKLGKLAHLEKIKLMKEKDQLEETIENCNKIINSSNERQKIFLKRFQDFCSKFLKERRTKVINIPIGKDNDEKENIMPEDVVVIMSRDGYIKRIKKEDFKTQKRNGKGVKTVDNTPLGIISTNTIDTLMLFSNKGKMYKINVDDVPEGTNNSKGIAVISNLLKLENNEDIIAITSLSQEKQYKYVLFFTKKGLIKKTFLSEYIKTKRKNGVKAIKLNEGDSIANVSFANDEEIIVITENGFGIHFESKNITPIGRVTQGVKAINLSENDNVLQGLLYEKQPYLFLTSQKGLGKRIKTEELILQTRGGKGIIISKEEKLVGAFLSSDLNGSVFVFGNPNSICIPCEDYPLLSRTAAGVMLINGSKVYSAIKL